MTHACENITFPQLRWRTVKIVNELKPFSSFFATDLRAFTLLLVSERAALDRAHPLHRPDLLVRLVAQLVVLQSRRLLRLLQHSS